MGMRDERDFMQLAIREAERGRTRPNPRVGAVIVRDGEVIGRGYHAAAGEAHAEVSAIADAGGSLSGATMFVTLEPCNHEGRTGPCTDAILQADIARVVIGSRDPARHGVSGIERLRAEGVVVETGLLSEQTDALVADFAKHVSTGLPLVTLKAAVTLDGKIATRSGDSKWITGPEARAETHRMRDRVDAILVGIGTVLADDPELTVRHVPGHDPIRVVLDSRLRTQMGAKVIASTAPSNAPTWLFHAPDVDPGRKEALQSPRTELIAVPRRNGKLDLRAVLRALGARDVMHLMVEGGARVHGSFLEEGLADRAAIFVAPKIIGDADAVSLAAGRSVPSLGGAARLVRTRGRAVGEDWLIEGDFERKD